MSGREHACRPRKCQEHAGLFASIFSRVEAIGQGKVESTRVPEIYVLEVARTANGGCICPYRQTLHSLALTVNDRYGKPDGCADLRVAALLEKASVGFYLAPARDAHFLNRHVPMVCRISCPASTLGVLRFDKAHVRGRRGCLSKLKQCASSPIDFGWRRRLLPTSREIFLPPESQK